MESQEILNKYGSTCYAEIGDTQKFDTSIDWNLAKNGDSAPIFIKVIGQELSHGSSADIYSHCRVDLTSNAVGTQEPDFMHLGLPAVNSLDELNPSDNTATRVRSPMDGYN